MVLQPSGLWTFFRIDGAGRPPRDALCSITYRQRLAGAPRLAGDGAARSERAPQAAGDSVPAQFSDPGRAQG